MSKGLYQTNIKKLRTLYSQKLQSSLMIMNRWGAGFIRPVNSSSGINMLISVKSKKPAALLCKEAGELGISTLPITTFTDAAAETTATLIFNYNQIPLEEMEPALRGMIEKWKKE